MGISGIYIYGIINSDKEIIFPDCKVMSGEDVYTITYEDISAVVSDSEIVDYNSLIKEKVAEYLLRHQLVIENVMNIGNIGEESNIIPMQLGTYAMDEDEVRSILAKGYRMIKQIIGKTYGKTEIDVVASWANIGTVLKEAANEKEIRVFKEELLNKEGGVSVEDQIRTGVLIRKYLDKRRELCASKIAPSLVRVSKDYRIHELMDDNMILNIAFLIEKSRLNDFWERVEGLDNEFSGKINFRCVGPLPPYSFNTLVTKRIRYADIASAKEKLNLSDIVTKEDIKKAYRRKAFLNHPDKKMEIQDTHIQFNDVVSAYKTLAECCNDDSSFKIDSFKDAIIIKEKNHYAAGR
ncbi:MAG: GvpL/GvpF family gas vesicle protein [Nitrospirae bacterium]|nr:GvpL/GvpF family gas vesicle protein [Nitrospirota bacterium]